MFINASSMSGTMLKALFNLLLAEISQDVGIQRPREHLLSQAHHYYDYL